MLAEGGPKEMVNLYKRLIVHQGPAAAGQTAEDADRADFYEFKATRALEDFFLDFFKRDLRAIYNGLQEQTTIPTGKKGE